MKKFVNEIQELLNLYKHKKFKLAEKYAKNLINKYPKNPLIYNVLGLILTAQNKIEKGYRNCRFGRLRLPWDYQTGIINTRIIKRGLSHTGIIKYPLTHFYQPGL